MFSLCLIFFIKAYVESTRSNYIDDAIEMDTHNICLHKEVGKKCTGCNLKTTASVDCLLMGVCAVNRSTTVIISSAMKHRVFFYFSTKNLCCGYYQNGYSLKPPRGCASNEYRKKCFLGKIRKYFFLILLLSRAM